jgi:hypothetical protein
LITLVCYYVLVTQVSALAFQIWPLGVLPFKFSCFM